MFKLDLINTLAFAGVILFIGYAVRRQLRWLERYNVPAPVVGGLLVAVAITIARVSGRNLIEFNIASRDPLMIAFFTTIGFGASFSLLRVGGPQVLIFFIMATIFAVVQNIIGVLVALPFGLSPLFGVLAGSVTLTGGPATGLAFADRFEEAGVQGAAAIAVAVAMGGIVSGGIIGGPIGTFLIERFKLRTAMKDGRPHDPLSATAIIEEQLPEAPPAAPPGEDKESFLLLKNLVLILVAMWIGSWVSQWIEAARLPFPPYQLTLPKYIGAMLVAAAFRNLDDWTRVFKISQRTIDDLGNVALSLFLVIAIMTLRLWELAGLALPMILILAAQVLVIFLICIWPIFRIMGRDYDAAVMSSGFCGFMLGTTANAMANMEAIVSRYGPSPRAFLVVPMVGAFFIDFTNALIITVCLNIWR